MAKWGFLTNHALVLIHVYEHPRSTLREIAAAVGITERAALSILRQMEEDGCVSRVKEGRRIRYTVNLNAVLALQAQGPYNIEQLVTQLAQLIKWLRDSGGEDGAPSPTGGPPPG